MYFGSPLWTTAVLAASGGRDTWRNIWATHGVAILDNERLDGPQLDYIDRLLTLVPPSLHDLRAISVKGFLGQVPIKTDLRGLPYEVNTFTIRVNGGLENQFPPDVASRRVPIFTSATAHELNHVVDATTVNGEQALRSRRNQLIADAGDDPMNYLRSMLPPSFFSNAPQEFFASISNGNFCTRAASV